MEYYETGDPTALQRATGEFLGGAFLGKFSTSTSRVRPLTKPAINPSRQIQTPSSRFQAEMHQFDGRVNFRHDAVYDGLTRTPQ